MVFEENIICLGHMKHMMCMKHMKHMKPNFREDVGDELLPPPAGGPPPSKREVFGAATVKAFGLAVDWI